MIIRYFDDWLTARLQARAARSGRSAGEEAQSILRRVLDEGG